MKIYTKTGDKGQTSLIGGVRVPKHNLRIEAYGTVDELNSHIGLLRDQPIDEHSIKILIEIQDRLFTIGSHLAADPVKSRMKLPDIKEEDVTLLENEMDKMNETLPEMRSFVLPGGHTIVSYCHIARCVCRRAERCVTHLASVEHVEEITYIYLNRLSDYLFVLSRKITQDLNAKEIPWKPRM
ncbi:MAG: cob(I)yrinic acid a,c-diamide adenosyltransferase [Bacteroidia bacterium]